MPDGGSFRISTLDEGEDVVMRFSDTGHGIPQEVQDRLFQSFVTSGKKDGTGLGLAIVKKIVDQHDGSISFETEAGKGTTFIIRLPRGA
jgi:signal transduction histidine kinase